MTNRIALTLLSLALLAGCQTAKPPGDLPPPEGDLAYLLTANPAAVTPAQLIASVAAADARVLSDNLVEGIYWQAIRYDNATAPNGYGSGGDSLLFSGMYLASRAYRYGVTKDSDDLDQALEALRGIYILTHVSGAPGALMRCAFPTATPEPWHYPGAWQSRIDKGFVYDSPTDVADPFNPGQSLPQMTFYTRVTRDQITGLVYGLSVFWNVMDPAIAANASDRAKLEQARQILAQTVEDVYRKLRADDWSIRDQTGRNDTNSDSVGEDLLRLSLLGLYRHTATLTGDAARVERIQDKYEDILYILRTLGVFPSDPFNAFSNAQQYYAWNLRFTRASALWMNADVSDRPLISDYIRRWMFKWVSGHKNAWFSLVYAVTTSPTDQDIVDDAVLSLRSWALRPATGWPSPLAMGWGRDYSPPSAVERISGVGNDRVLWPHLRKPTTYWTWQKDPWDAGTTYPIAGFDGVGLDLILPYWMARYYGLIQ